MKDDISLGAAISYEPQDAWTPLIRGSFMKRKVDRVTANHYLRLGIAFTVTFPLAIPNLSCHIRSAATTLDSWRCEYNSMVGRFPFATTLKVLHGCYWRTCSSKIFIWAAARRCPRVPTSSGLLFRKENDGSWNHKADIGGEDAIYWLISAS